MISLPRCCGLVSCTTTMTTTRCTSSCCKGKKKKIKNTIMVWHYFTLHIPLQYTQCVCLKQTAMLYKWDPCVGKPPTPQHYEDQGGSQTISMRQQRWTVQVEDRKTTHKQCKGGRWEGRTEINKTLSAPLCLFVHKSHDAASEESSSL